MTVETEKFEISSRQQIILVVLIDRYLPILGGAQINVHQLCRNLSNRGFEIIVLTRRIYQELPCAENIDGIQILRFGFNRIRLISKVLCAASITAYLIRNRNSMDIVCCVPCVNTTDMLPAYIAHQLTKVPYVVRITSMKNNFDLLLQPKQKSLSVRLIQTILRPSLYKRLYHRAWAVVVQSKIIRDHAHTYGIQDCPVIANGLDTNRFYPVSTKRRTELRKELGLPLDSVIAAYTSRYAWQKNQKALIEAVELINTKPLSQKVYALIIGATERNHEESSEQELREYVAKKELKDQVGFVNDSLMVEKYLQAADLFVMPTMHPEGMSNSLLEAMATGLPAVVSDQAVLRCMFPEGQGVFVDPENVSEIAKHIEIFANDPKLCASVGAALSAHVQSKYSIEAAAESYALLLKKIASYKYHGK